MRLLGVLSASAAFLALLGPTYVDAAKPQINKKDFDFLPKSYFYFEDSPVILSLEDQSGIVWRSDDDGKNWEPIEKIPKGKVLDIYPHPFDKSKAYALTLGLEHFVTSNKGKSWQKFETKWPPSLQRNPLSHHSKKHDHVLYTGMECKEDKVWRGRFWCWEKTWYTKDGFDSEPKELMDKLTHGCMFARSTHQFDKGSELTILCIVDGAKKGAENWVLLVSDGFSGPWKEPALDGFKEFPGVTGLAAVKKFIVAAVKSAGTDEMSLFVSDDADNWDRAEFPSQHGGLKQDAYTILESTEHSIQVDVLTTWNRNPIGALFTSNSNGTYFTKNIDNTNRNAYGTVDFEQVANIQGIVLVNIVDNAKEVLQGNGNEKIAKKVKSQISFDGGRTFKDLKVGKDGKLHVHSVTDARNGGRVFSSPAPGILLAVGNIGNYLSDYDHGDLYVSDDAGLTWLETGLKGPHMYEFGDSGSILVAVADKIKTDRLRYSLNHGKDWESVDLGVELRVAALTTAPDSTPKKFTMIALGNDGKSYIFSINFDGVLNRQCKKDDDEKKSDYEKWYARLDEKGDPDCLMGHKQFFYRRKKDADCFVNADYKDPVPVEENCACTEEDYECDFEFAAEDGKGKCELIGKLKVPVGACKKEGDKFKGSSGYRLIPGNTCTKGIKMDEEKEWDCEKGQKGVTPPSSGKIKSVTKTFGNAGKFMEYYYLERKRSASGDDETIVMRTDENKIYITHNQGATWDMPSELKDQEINAIYPNPYNQDTIFFTTPSKKFFYSIDRGQTFQEGVGPDPPTRRVDIPLALRFHPIKSDYIIWISDRDCKVPTSKSCHAAAYYSLDRGRTWPMLSAYVRNCAWIHSSELSNTPETLVFCERYAKDERPSDANPIKLVARDDFKTEITHFEKIMGFATMEEFIVAAEVKDESSLRLHTSVDGKHFAEAHFPHNFHVDKQQAYTLLDSVTHAIFLHVTVNPMEGYEYGAILKSNSNGTSYVLSLPNVNRNEAGFVDFEKMQGLEGVAIVNVVVNVDEVNKGGKKKLKSKITHNDGGAWNYLPPPKKDVDGKDYSCDIKDLEKCSLNLHGYTERKDPADTFSSGSAVGVLVGVGNVGEYLTSKRDGNTYITRDGGVTWKEIRKGSYMWEYGDQGSIIVIVDEDDPTDTVYYTLDEGETWNEYKFEGKMHVTDITTIPSDTSRKFLLWGNPVGRGEKVVTVQIDFTGLTDRQCKLPGEPNDKDSDFELWEPPHPNLDIKHACLFGHHVEYYRKKTDHLCYVGPKGHEPIESKKCACEKHDFECDFNYERGNDGACHLVHGLEKPNHEEFCAKNKSLVEWYGPTGYRKIPLTKCEGGMELDKGVVKPCPGHEKEFHERYGPGGWAIFFGIIFALTGAGAIGWYVWNRWTGKFGAIRLGEDSSGGQSPFVRYPIIFISAVVAVAVAIPAIIQLAVGWVVSKLSRPKRFTTRGSFARGDYAVVNDDDGELLGSDDEDEV